MIKMLEFAEPIIVDFWYTAAKMSPYLLLGFLVAGILSVLMSQSFVEKHLGGGGLGPLVKASLFGVPLPLCSCGVIPVSISLHRHGAGKGSTISFLLSTPQTGVDSILATLSLLGPVLAVFRPIAAFATGIFGGALVNVFDREERQPNHRAEKCTDDCCSSSGNKSKVLKGLKYGFVILPRDIGRAILIGLVSAAFIAAFVPDVLFAEKLLGTGFFSMVVMMFLGIPVYVCATASIPVAAALILKGLTPGAALVFLITGPATNAAAFTTIWKALGGRTATVYICTVAFSALASGIILDTMFPGLGSSVRTHLHRMEPSIFGHISAVILLSVLAYAIFSKTRHSNDERDS
jgi:hypothetical protein